MPPKTPATTAARKEESRHNQWWYPRRCELPGCDAGGQTQLYKCSACCMVEYCCQEHQRDDWKAHKKECKVFQRLNMRATFYNDEDMLERFPLRPRNQRPRRAAAPPSGSSCALCLTPDSKVGMTVTECCGQPVCNTSHQYELMSYSRDYCERSHDRYTLCGYHGVEAACDKSKDWRECPKCTQASSRSDLPDTLWRGLNPYNFCPMLSKDVPRHSICDICEECSQPFIVGMEGGASAASGFMCMGCSNKSFLRRG